MLPPQADQHTGWKSPSLRACPNPSAPTFTLGPQPPEAKSLGNAPRTAQGGTSLRRYGNKVNKAWKAQDTHITKQRKVLALPRALQAPALLPLSFLSPAHPRLCSPSRLYTTACVCFRFGFFWLCLVQPVTEPGWGVAQRVHLKPRTECNSAIWNAIFHSFFFFFFGLRDPSSLTRD